MRSTNSKRSRAGDQSPPPQPPNAYALFVREKHAETKARETSRRRGNNVTPQQVITSLSKAWSALSTAEMKPFYAKADRARRRYVKACTIYEQMHETVPAPRRRRRKKAEKKVVIAVSKIVWHDVWYFPNDGAAYKEKVPYQVPLDASDDSDGGAEKENGDAAAAGEGGEEEEEEEDVDSEEEDPIEDVDSEEEEEDVDSHSAADSAADVAASGVGALIDDEDDADDEDLLS